MPQEILERVLGAAGQAPDTAHILCVGYVDESDPVNAFHPERAPLAEYTQWHDRAAAGNLPTVPNDGHSDNRPPSMC